MTRASSPNRGDAGSALRRRPQLPRSLWQFRNFPRLSAQRQRRMTRLRTSHIPFIARPGFIYYCYFTREVSETRRTKGASGEEVTEIKLKKKRRENQTKLTAPRCICADDAVLQVVVCYEVRGWAQSKAAVPRAPAKPPFVLRARTLPSLFFFIAERAGTYIPTEQPAWKLN